MPRDGVVAGVNWRADPCGPERGPFKLCSSIEGALPLEIRAAYEELHAKGAR